MPPPLDSYRKRQKCDKQCKQSFPVTTRWFEIFYLMLQKCEAALLHENKTPEISERILFTAAFLLQYQSLSRVFPSDSSITPHPSFHKSPPNSKIRHHRSSINYSSPLNQIRLLTSYLEIPTGRHMWNWEWFSGSTGSHLHNPTNLPPPFKGSSGAFVLSVPGRPMRPRQNPGHKRNPFPWKLLSTSRGKKMKRRAFTADLFREHTERTKG